MNFFDKNLKTLRKKKGLRQQDMKIVIGFTQARWSSYESGVAQPGLDDFIRIADYFCISETDLLHKDISKEDHQPIERKKTDELTDNLVLQKLVAYQDAEILRLKSELAKCIKAKK